MYYAKTKSTSISIKIVSSLLSYFQLLLTIIISTVNASPDWNVIINFGGGAGLELNYFTEIYQHIF